MSYESSRLTIAAYLATNWGNQYPLFADHQGEQQPTGYFARYSLRPASAVSMHIGAATPKGRRVSIILWFQFFGLEGQGTAEANKFADLIVNMFDQKIMTTADGNRMLFRRTEYDYVGVEDSGRPMWAVRAPFLVDEL